MKGKIRRDHLDYLKDQLNNQRFYEAETGKAQSGHGWRKGGLCPFHDDTTEGNFYYHTDSGAFKCHACAAKGGDVIKFLMERYNLSFGKAVKELEGRL